MTSYAQVYKGPSDGTLVTLLVETDMPYEKLEAKYRDSFKYLYKLKTIYVSAAIGTSWELRKDKRSEIFGEEYFTALANTFNHPGIDAIIQPRTVTNLNTVLWNLANNGDHLTKEQWYTYRIEKYPEDLANSKARYPESQTWESKLSFQKCEELRRKYSGKKPIFTQVLPKGSPLVLVGLRSNEDNNASDRFVYSSINYDVGDKDVTQISNIIIRYLSTHVIPRMGRGVNKDTSGRFGYKQSMVIDKDKRTRYVKDVCTEVRSNGAICGGYFLPTSHGEYACTECGIIYEKNDVLVRKLKLGSSYIESHLQEDYLDEDENLSSEDALYVDSFTRREDREAAQAAKVLDRKNGVRVSDGVYSGEDDLPAVRETSMVEVVQLEEVEVASDKEDDSYTSEGMDYYDNNTTPTRKHLSDPLQKTNDDIGGVLPRQYSEIESRIEENLLYWKVSLEVPPSDEVKFHQRLIEVQAEHREAQKKRRNEKLARERQFHEVHSIYYARWVKKSVDYMEYRVRNMVRILGKTTQAELKNLFGASERNKKYYQNRGNSRDNRTVSRIKGFKDLHPYQVSRMLLSLAEKGRIIRTEEWNDLDLNFKVGDEHVSLNLFYTPPRNRVVSVKYIEYVPDRQVPVKQAFVDPSFKLVNRFAREPSGLYQPVIVEEPVPTWTPLPDENGRYTPVKKDEFKSATFPLDK